MEDQQKIRVGKLLMKLYGEEPPNYLISLLVHSANPKTLGEILEGRGKDLLNKGDNDELAQEVIDLGRELLQSTG